MLSIQDITIFLSQKPEFGIFSALFSSLLSLNIQPMDWIQFSGIVIALLIGIVTLLIKLFEFYDIIAVRIKNRRKKKKE